MGKLEIVASEARVARNSGAEFAPKIYSGGENFRINVLVNSLLQQEVVDVAEAKQVLTHLLGRYGYDENIGGIVDLIFSREFLDHLLTVLASLGSKEAAISLSLAGGYNFLFVIAWRKFCGRVCSFGLGFTCSSLDSECQENNGE